MASTRRRVSVATLLALAACAVNPATGRRELSLVSEREEIAMGREYDPQILAEMGLVADSSLQAYVSEIGQRMAARSERPQLPWSFRVVDDPAVNAFAVPGGYIYVTRGILAILDSEAELAGVLGHEIGHVTARHSASQMTRMQLQALGLGVGAVLSERVADYAGLAMAGLQIINLKYGRDDESQSDELGIRYMTRTGYDPDEIAGVFEALALVSGESSSRTPQWLSTHPWPENREERARELTAALPPELQDGAVGREEYLGRLEGLVYGQNPREGYFDDSFFFHPDLRFRLDFPTGWRTQNGKAAVVAQSPDEQAIVLLELADEDDPELALRAFVSQDGITPGRRTATTVNGLPAATASFSASTDQGELRGAVTFVALEGNVFQLLGFGSTRGWASHRAALEAWMESFAELTDPFALAVQPDRITIVRTPDEMTLRAFYEAYPMALPLEEAARINRRDADEVIPSGTLLKRVTAGTP